VTNPTLYWLITFGVTILSFEHYDSLAILSTLIACLPNESKELLHKNQLFISTPTSKPPLFNLVCIILQDTFKIDAIGRIIDNGLLSSKDN
jgi:hypothetical protein